MTIKVLSHSTSHQTFECLHAWYIDIYMHLTWCIADTAHLILKLLTFQNHADPLWCANNYLNRLVVLEFQKHEELSYTLSSTLITLVIVTLMNTHSNRDSKMYNSLKGVLPFNKTKLGISNAMQIWFSIFSLIFIIIYENKPL